MLQTRPPPRGGAAHERVDDVVDEDVVPGLLAVPVDRHRLVAQHAVGEDGHHPSLAVGVLPRPVDVPQRESAELEGVQLAIGHQVVNDGLLGHAVGRQGLLGMRFAHREVLSSRLAVERATTGGEDHPFGLGLARSLQHIERAHDVDRGVEGRSGNRDAHVGLGGQVEDQLGTTPRHQLDDRRCADVQRMDGEGPARAAAGLGQIQERARREVVDDVDLVPFDEQAVDQIGSDEPGASRDQRAHAPAFLARHPLAVDERPR